MLINEELTLNERWQAIMMLTWRWKDRLYETHDYLRINERVFIYIHQDVFAIIPLSHLSVEVEASLILSVKDRKKVRLQR